MPTMAEVRQKYPQYADLSDQQLAEGLHRKYYSDMPFEQFSQKIGYSAAPAPGFIDRAGAFAAGVNEGVAGIAGLPVDTMRNITELSKAAVGTTYHELTGNPIPDALQPLQDRSTDVLGSEWFKKKLGIRVPRPDDAISRRLADFGRAAPAALTRDPRAIIGAVAGSEAAGIAGEHGASPAAQTLIGIAGGLTPGAAATTATTATRLTRNLARPLTRSGQQSMAANILADQAQNPNAAAANLRNAQPNVPGSPRNAGEASGDLGLLAVEKGLKGRNSVPFAARESEQNAARQAELERLGGRPQDIRQLEAQRDATTGPMRQQAFASSGTANASQAVAVTDKVLASPAGKREGIASAMKWAKERIGNETDPASLYEIRKDLQLAQRGKLQPSSASAPNAAMLAHARGELGQVISALDDSIEAAAPGFKAYLKRHADLSKEIDQKKVIQEINRRAQLTGADISTRDTFIGASPYSRALDAALARPNKLTPQQIQDLQAIRVDLQGSQAINSNLKAPGSDTFQNLSMAQVIGTNPMGMHPALRVVTSPLQWVYKAAGSDARVNEILTEAMLDPKIAATLLDRATPTNARKISFELKKRLAAHGLGAVVAASSRAGETSEDRNRPEK